MSSIPMRSSPAFRAARAGNRRALDVNLETLYQVETMSQKFFERPISESRRERNIAERRQRILAAARALLSRGGLGALSMRKLAEEASLSVNTLYNLWGTREEILEAVTTDATERMAASLPVFDSADDPLDFCRKLVRTNVRHACSEHEVFRPMTLAWLEGEISGQPSPIEPIAQSIFTLAKVIREANRRGVLEGPLRPEHIAWQIGHGVHFALIQWALGGIDDAHFEARALYGLELALLGFVQGERRTQIKTKLKGLERKLRMPPLRSRENALTDRAAGGARGEESTQ
jgi:AcrR family transcriptional regulator